jgi:hypothetical protein
MIQIDLVDKTNKLKHVEFHAVPVTTEIDFTCIPEGVLPLSSVVQLSLKLKSGRVSGRIGDYIWYRLTGAPHVRHKSPLINQL